MIERDKCTSDDGPIVAFGRTRGIGDEFPDGEYGRPQASEAFRFGVRRALEGANEPHPSSDADY